MSLIPRRSNRLSTFSSVNAWNFQVRESVNLNEPAKALLLYREMKREGIEPSKLTFPFVAKACARLSDLKYSEIIHAHVMKSPFWSDVYVGTAMVDMYVKCNRLDNATKMFERMPDKDVAAWNVMLSGFSQSGLMEETFHLFREMRLNEIEPDPVTVMTLIQSVSSGESLKLLKALHSLGIRLGLNPQVTVANTWISAYAKCNDFDSAKSVFELIQRSDRTVVSWNSVIGACAHLEDAFDAISFYRRMLREEFTPDLSTFINLAASCLNHEALTTGKLIHSHSIHLGSDQDVAVVNTLISMYSKCGDIYSARVLFDEMSVRTCVSWTVMISGYAGKCDMNEALALFLQMHEAGEKPDEVTLLSLIAGCGKSGSLELGRWINAACADSNRLKNIMICNALIDMYSKCGSIREARGVFDHMQNKTVVTWTVMIAGYALNGNFFEAFEFFDKMVDLDYKPNHITFLAVLQACAHSGCLEKGWEYFRMMKEVYDINPGLDHYSCMVDLLGKKGKLEEALELVESMRAKPDAGIWGALLSACKTHRNVEVAEAVADHLFGLEPQSAAPYVEMANIYAWAGMWEEVARVRLMMKCRKVKKKPGESAVQLNGKNHVFTVEDRDHPQSGAIYSVLCSLSSLAHDETFQPIL